MAFTSNFRVQIVSKWILSTKLLVCWIWNHTEMSTRQNNTCNAQLNAHVLDWRQMLETSGCKRLKIALIEGPEHLSETHNCPNKHFDHILRAKVTTDMKHTHAHTHAAVVPRPEVQTALSSLYLSSGCLLLTELWEWTFKGHKPFLAFVTFCEDSFAVHLFKTSGLHVYNDRSGVNRTWRVQVIREWWCDDYYCGFNKY